MNSIHKTQTKTPENEDTQPTPLPCEDVIFAPALVILTDSDGLYNLPNNVLLVLAVTSTKDEEKASGEIHKFFTFLAELCQTHSIQHLVFAFDKTESDDPHIVKEANVTCLRLY